MPAPFIPSAVPRRRCSCRYPVEVPYSLLLDASAATAQYLSRAYSTAATVTVFAAVKRGALGALSPILGSVLYFDASDHLVAWGTTTAEYFRDPSAWYLIEAGPSGLRVNGVVLATSLATAAVVNQPVGYNGSNRFDGYLAEIHVVDGLDVVGQFTAARGQAAVCAGYSGSHGAAGTHLAFSNAAALGADAAGVGNWTVNGAPVQTPDGPTINRCVLNRLGANLRTPTTVQEANLYWSNASGSLAVAVLGTLCVQGRAYWEATCVASGASFSLTHCVVGVARADMFLGEGGFPRPGEYGYSANGNIFTDGVASMLGAGFTTGDVVGVAVDTETGRVWIAVNGAWIGDGDPASGENPAIEIVAPVPDLQPLVQGYAGATWRINCGHRAFQYTPPSGFLPGVSTAGLGCDLEVLAGEYTGNGSADGPVVWTGCELESLTIGATTYYNDSSAGVVDFLATGFKLRTTSAPNTSSTTYTWSGVRRVAVKCATAGVN